MLAGHFAAAIFGYGADILVRSLSQKRNTKLLGTESLFMFCISSQLPDLLTAIFTIIGLENWTYDQNIVDKRGGIMPFKIQFPLSHSLLSFLLMATAVAALHYFVRRTSWKTSAIHFILVLSHWALDVFTHRHGTMPITPNTTGIDFRPLSSYDDDLTFSYYLGGLQISNDHVLYCLIELSIVLWSITFLLVCLGLTNKPEVEGPTPDDSASSSSSSNLKILSWVDAFERIPSPNDLVGLVGDLPFFRLFAGACCFCTLFFVPIISGPASWFGAKFAMVLFLILQAGIHAVAWKSDMEVKDKMRGNKSQ